MTKEENLITVLKQYNDNAKHLAFLNTGVLAFFIAFLNRIELPKLAIALMIILLLFSLVLSLMVVGRTLRDIEFLITKQKIIEVDFKLINKLWMSGVWCFIGAIYSVGIITLFDLLD